MKKQMAWVLVAGAFGGPAVAQSQASGVEVYGILDAGFSHVSGTRAADTSMVSGIMDGSRLGFRGNEDIGAGWRALFTLESRVEMNNGTLGNRAPTGTQLADRFTDLTLLGLPNTPTVAAGVAQVAATLGSQIGVNVRNGIWDRQAYVGLVTPVGALLAGRQYTPAYEVFANFDATRTASSLSAGQISAIPATIDIRADNALAYRIQLDGLSASVMHTFDGATPSSANRLVGAQAIYRAEKWSLGFGYNERNNEVGDKSLKSFVTGATLDIGPGKLSALYGGVRDRNPAGLSVIPAGPLRDAFTSALKQDAHLYNIGYTLVTGALTSTVAVSKFDDNTGFDADVVSYGVNWTYALSKRTDLNLVLTRFDNKGLAQAAPGQAGFLGGFTTAPGVDAKNLALGLRHRF